MAGSNESANQVSDLTVRSDQVGKDNTDLRNQVSVICTQVANMAKVQADFQKTMNETLTSMRNDRTSQSELVMSLSGRMTSLEASLNEFKRSKPTNSSLPQASSVHSGSSAQDQRLPVSNLHGNIVTQNQGQSGPNNSLSNTSNQPAVIPVQVGHHSIKRDYKLTKDEKWDFFLDKFLLELNYLGIQYITRDLTTTSPISPTSPIAEPHKLIIKDVVLNRIDKIYHEKIVGKDDPLDILKTLRLAKTREVPTTSVSARHTLHTIKYEHTREKADEFIQRFEQIIRAHDNISGVDPISVAEKRDAIYQAIRIAYPGVQHANFLCQTHNQRELNYEELKKYIIERELDKLQNSDSDPKAALSAKKQRKFVPRNDASFKRKCKVCHQNTSDHNEKNCPWQGTGYKICYNCNQVVNHVAANCPMARTHQERRDNHSYRGHGRAFKRNSYPRQDDKKRPKTNAENFRGRGRGGRGRGRSFPNQQQPPSSNNQFPNSQGHMASLLPGNPSTSTGNSQKP
ncbi:hypothetical protein QAD02_007627 [Eretmocerus hayati]|uniref:Uncharacterized protein n=1 Tax=Eretmocerus hayati TaxID=131215 RepID=A0ACC2N466_9HYME|nr:hypothetical protein QAD02_007627 [Eretmocerus hayati]